VADDIPYTAYMQADAWKKSMGSEQPLLAWRSHTESNIWIGNLQTQIIRSQLFCWLLQSGTVATRDILSKNTGYILSSGVKINLIAALLW